MQILFTVFSISVQQLILEIATSYMEKFLISPCAGYLWCCLAERLGPALGVNPAVSEMVGLEIFKNFFIFILTPAEWNSFLLRRFSGKDTQAGRGLSPLEERKPTVNRLDFNSNTVKMYQKWTGATIIIPITPCWALTDWWIYILPGQAMPSEKYKPLPLPPLHQGWMQSLLLLRAAHPLIPAHIFTLHWGKTHIQDSIFHFPACCINKLMTLLSVFPLVNAASSGDAHKTVSPLCNQLTKRFWRVRKKKHTAKECQLVEKKTQEGAWMRIQQSGTSFRWAAQVRAIFQGAEKWRMFQQLILAHRASLGESCLEEWRGCCHETWEHLLSLLQFAEFCAFGKFSHLFCWAFLASPVGKCRCSLRTSIFCSAKGSPKNGNWNGVERHKPTERTLEKTPSERKIGFIGEEI